MLAFRRLECNSTYEIIRTELILLCSVVRVVFADGVSKILQSIAPVDRRS